MTRVMKTSYIAQALVMFLLAPCSHAQQNSGQQGQQGQSQQKPLDTRINQPATTNSNPDADNTDQTQPDSHALSGVGTYGVGGTDHSYFLPSAQIAEYGDTNPGFGSGVNFQPITSFGGQLLFQKLHRRQKLSLQYSGGAVIYDRGNAPNSTYQQMAVTEAITGRRVSVSLSDYFSYLPESGYGAGGFGTPFGGGPPSLFGIGGIPFGLNPGFISSQSIFSNFSKRFDNSSLGELDYLLSSRSSITMSGGADILHFFGSSLLDSHTYIVRSGYNYQLSPRNTLSVLYDGTLFYYDQFPIDDFQAHAAQVAYGRRITGRLGFQASGGPQIIVPKVGNSFTTWTFSSSLQYAWQRAQLGIGYDRYTSNGGGFYFGAYTNEVRANYSRQVTRTWNVNIDAAFARNTAISFALNPATGATPYNSIYAGASVSRPIGRYVSAFANYNVQWQQTGFCQFGVGCGPGFTRHIFGVGFNWNFRRIGSEDVFHAIGAGKAR